MTPSDEFGYDRRYEYQNYAHLLAAQGNYTQALKIVDVLVKAAEDVGDRFYKIQYQVLQAIILNKLNKPDKAMAAMEDALILARTEGYVRTILDEGKAVGDLLRKSIARGTEVSYANKLLTALDGELDPSKAREVLEADLLDPLSLRELEVLRLLVTDLSVPEIAAELVVSVSTVRSHIKNIYSKLDVHSRHEAVTKARELGLLF